MSVALKRFSNHISGKAANSTSGETIDVVNRATRDVIAAVPNSTADDIDNAVEAAEPPSSATGATRRRRSGARS